MSKSSLLRVYHYPACSTCKTALKYLKTQNIPFEAVHIVDTPPTLPELRQVLKAVQARGGGIKNLFNTSGLVYKEMGLSQKLSGMSNDEALQLLSENGKLIKRPFVVSANFSAVGFLPEVWPKA